MKVKISNRFCGLQDFFTKLVLVSYIPYAFYAGIYQKISYFEMGIVLFCQKIILELITGLSLYGIDFVCRM